MKRSSLIAFSFVLFCSASWAAEPPWLRHGALRVSANGHRIEHTDGTPFLWLGDTAWGMFQQLTREDVDHYLDNRRELGFTVIQSVAFWYPHGGGMKSGPHNAANAYGHRPFIGAEDAPDTVDPLVVPGGSPGAPNDYWDHVDYVVEAVKRRNMYLALLPVWGRAYVTPQFGGAHEEFTADEARAFGAFLGGRYRDQPHIVWVVGGDAKAQLKGYDKNQNYRDYDRRHVFRAMAEGITYGVTGQRPAWNEPHRAWDQVFMTYHPDGDPEDNSSTWFHTDPWLDVNGVEVWREVDEVYPTMLDDYERDAPAKPSLFLEGSYEYGSYRHECGWVTPVRVRRQAYQTFFAGGAGHTYGAGPIWAMRGTGGDYNCGYTWRQALAFPGAVQFAVGMKAFLLEHDWSEWIPDGGVIVGSVGEGDTLKTGAKTADGGMALVYYADNSHTSIRNTLDRAAEAYWFDPRDGRKEPAGRFGPEETKGMRPPGGWEDAVLVLRVSQPVVWRFDNLDKIGGHPVTVQGEPKVIDTPDGRAIEFDGVDDAIFLDVHPLEWMPAFTVEVVFNPYANGAPEQRFFHMQENGSESRVMFETRLVEGGRWFLDTFVRSGDQNVALYAKEHRHDIGPWRHAAIVVDGKTLRHYVDGRLELSEALQYEPQRAGRTSLGARLNKVHWFKGAIRTVRITPQPLAPEAFLAREDHTTPPSVRGEARPMDAASSGAPLCDRDGAGRAAGHPVYRGEGQPRSGRPAVPLHRRADRGRGSAGCRLRRGTAAPLRRYPPQALLSDDLPALLCWCSLPGGVGGEVTSATGC